MCMCNDMSMCMHMWGGGTSPASWADSDCVVRARRSEGALAALLGSIPLDKALEMAASSYSTYRTHLRDQWDFRDIAAVRNDGPNGTRGVRPYCNSHYTRHLLGLHALPLALTGQHYDARAASLSFNRQRDALSEQGPWPYFTPQGSGIVRELSRNEPLARGADGCASLRALSGRLRLLELRVDGVALRCGPSGPRSQFAPLNLIADESGSEEVVVCACGTRGYK
jgi:hypothetical protein